MITRFGTTNMQETSRNKQKPVLTHKTYICSPSLPSQTPWEKTKRMKKTQCIPFYFLYPSKYFAYQPKEWTVSQKSQNAPLPILHGTRSLKPLTPSDDVTEAQECERWRVDGFPWGCVAMAAVRKNNGLTTGHLGCLDTPKGVKLIPKECQFLHPP